MPPSVCRHRRSGSFCLLVALCWMGWGCASKSVEPDAGTLDGATRPDADATTPPIDAAPDADQPDGGAGDACARAEAIRSYVGCEYFAAPFAQHPDLDDRSFDFRVVVANPSAEPADVTVMQGHLVHARRRVAPGGVVEIPLPWVRGLSFPADTMYWSSSTVVPDGAYRLVSTRPVIASQFNPFHYASFTGGGYSYTNDASLLLPTHALGREHLAATYVPTSSPGGSTPGWIAVIGVSPVPTSVEVVAAGPIAADSGGRWEATEAGQTVRFTLARGEVAQLLGVETPRCSPERPGHSDYLCREDDYDLTGSRITSDHPVAAFSGHVCAFVPYDTPACDHLETQLPPVPTWGRRFETMPMRDPGTDVQNILRVVAARDGTTVTFEPPLEGTSAVALQATEHVELSLTGAVSITGDAPIQVAQLLVGMHSTDPPLDRGDPALTLLVPAEQFRYDYVFTIPGSYPDGPEGRAYILISREAGSPIELDGAVVEAAWTRAGDRELAIVPMAGGAHRARAETPFGLIAFGLGSYTSYACPAGLDLNDLL